jgi:DNA-binding NarL/FixJ family response regulator
VIRVYIVDDHPALRAGLRTVLELEPGFGYAGESAGDEELWTALRRADADVLLVDYHLPAGDGLQICREARRRELPLRTMLYTAWASPALSLPAAVAGVDGMVGKDAGASELFDAIRYVHRGQRVLAPPPPAVLDEARVRLDPQELALAGLMMDRSSDEEAAATLGIERAAVDRLVKRVLGKLHVEVPAPPA